MGRESRRSVLVLLVAVALTVAACSSSDDTADESLPPNTSDTSGSSGMVVDGGISVGEALAYMGDEPVAVEGFVVIDAEGARLCEALAESFPPQCGGAHLDITNPDVLTQLPLIEEGETQWTETYVTLLGQVNENEFTVDEFSL